DGTLADDADHARRREFVLVKHRDGSGEARNYLAPGFIALMEAYLDTVPAPHGDLITVPKALELVSGGDTATCVLFDPTGAIMSYGQTKRLVPGDMRLAITARDRGCSFPGCTRPAAWCQAHHFDEFVADHGPTAIDNCGLACTFHPRYYQLRGWRSEFIDGIPHWIPPKRIDPVQKPLRNRMHHPPPM